MEQRFVYGRSSFHKCVNARQDRHTSENSHKQHHQIKRIQPVNSHLHRSTVEIPAGKHGSYHLDSLAKCVCPKHHKSDTHDKHRINMSENPGSFRIGRNSSIRENTPCQTPHKTKVQLAPCHNPVAENTTILLTQVLRFPFLFPPRGMYKYSLNHVEREICHLLQNSLMLAEI